MKPKAWVSRHRAGEGVVGPMDGLEVSGIPEGLGVKAASNISKFVGGEGRCQHPESRKQSSGERGSLHLQKQGLFGGDFMGDSLPEMWHPPLGSAMSEPLILLCGARGVPSCDKRSHLSLARAALSPCPCPFSGASWSCSGMTSALTPRACLCSQLWDHRQIQMLWVSMLSPVTLKSRERRHQETQQKLGVVAHARDPSGSRVQSQA